MQDLDPAACRSGSGDRAKMRLVADDSGRAAPCYAGYERLSPWIPSATKPRDPRGEYSPVES